jgi:membrane protease YdiL (CAAX protease family)
MVLSSYGYKLPTAANLLQIFFLFGQGLVAIFYTGINEGKPGIKQLLRRLIKWRVGIHWYLIVFFVPALISLAVRQICGMIGITIPPLKAPGVLLTSFATIFLGYLLLNTEELAWRGVALPKFQERFSPNMSSLIIGIIWGVFHIPIFLMKGGHPAGFQFHLYMLMVLAMSFIMTWTFNGTGGSLLLVHLLHQSMNTWSEVFPSFPRALHSYTPAIITTIFLIVWAVIVSIPKQNKAQTQINPAT